jgi:hypothetical protein
VQTQPTKQQADTDQAQRDDEASARWWTVWLTGFLCLITLSTGIVVGWQAWETRKAANAAKLSASTAERSLRLLNQPWLDTADWAVSEERGSAIRDKMGGWTTGELLALNVSLNVVNNSQTPATIYQIEMTDSGSGSPPTDFTVTSVVGNLITPGSKHPAKAHIAELAPSQIARYESGTGFPIRIEGTIHFGDLFSTKDPNDDSIDGPRKRHFGRECVLRTGGRSEFHPIAGAESVEPELGHESQTDDYRAKYVDPQRST